MVSAEETIILGMGISPRSIGVGDGTVISPAHVVTSSYLLVSGASWWL